MIWIIFGVTLLVFIVGALLRDSYNLDEFGFVLELLSGLAGLIVIVVIMVLMTSVSHLGVIDEKIAMYQEENTKIENQIAVLVTNYQNYEKDIFDSVTADSAITLVQMYPELKSDTLVRSQIEIYLENNQHIKTLREEKINGTVSRWWLYFGN